MYNFVFEFYKNYSAHIFQLKTLCLFCITYTLPDYMRTIEVNIIKIILLVIVQ